MLDVVRGVAITLVVLYHLPNQPVRAGFIGVDLFMVVSGYLVTNSLITTSLEWHDICEFWRRRARRVIAPALVLVLAVVLLRTLSWRLSPRDEFWDGAAAVGFVANWRFVSSGTDYFRSVAGFSPFQHLWSLSVEGQFYLVWPLFVFFAKKKLRAIAMVLALGSFALMAMFYHSGNLSRAYFGSDSRFGTLLIGALLAIAVGRHKTFRFAVRRWSFELLVFLFVMVALLASGTRPFMYKGGFLAVALLAGGIVCCASESSPGHNSIFGSKSLFSIFHLIGIRSFSLYLVHWPIFVALDSSNVVANRLLTITLGLLVSAVFTEVMYRTIEVSWTRRYGFKEHLTLKLMSAIFISVLVLFAVGAYSHSSPNFLGGGSKSQFTHGGEGKVLLVGDSLVQSLVDLGITEKAQDFNLDFVAISGCGLLPGIVVDVNKNVYEPSRECESRVEENLWNRVSADSYDLVLWLNAWDAEDRILGSLVASQVNNSEDFQDAYSDVVAQLGKLARQVVIITVPERAKTSMTDEKGPSTLTRERYKASDQNLKKSARSTGSLIIDLSDFVCRSKSPCDDSSPTGERFRPIDGIHFSGPGGAEVVRWLREQIADLLSN